MTHPASLSNSTPLGLMALILIQVICAIFFATDVVADFAEGGLATSEQYHLIVESVATVSLCAAILLEMRYFLYLLRRKAHLEKSASVATMAVFDIIESHFDAWQRRRHGQVAPERDLPQVGHRQPRRTVEQHHRHADRGTPGQIVKPAAGGTRHRTRWLIPCRRSLPANPSFAPSLLRYCRWSWHN